MLYNLNVPDLAVRQSEIDSLVSAFETAAGPNLLDFIEPCFKFAGSNDCSHLYLDDISNYSEVDINNVSIDVSFVYRNACGDFSECCAQSSFELTPAGRLRTENFYGDGKYCALITITYDHPVDDDFVTYTYETEICLQQFCCYNKIVDLQNTVHHKLADAMCRVLDYELIGKPTHKLYHSIYKLSSMYHLLSWPCVGCDDYEVLACLEPKIKTNNC